MATQVHTQRKLKPKSPAMSGPSFNLRKGDLKDTGKAQKPKQAVKDPKHPENIDWDLVDVSQIEFPTPRFPEPKVHYEDGRTFHKHPHSRKVFMHSTYVNLLLQNPIILFFDMHKVDTHTRLKLQIALAPHNAETKVIRRRIFTNALRVAKYLETTRPGPREMWDPSGLAMHAKLVARKRSNEELEIKALLKGQQPCALYFNGLDWRPESLDPSRIVAVMNILEKTGKTPLLGARFQRTVVTTEDLKYVGTMESLGKSRSELVGLLGGTARALAATLNSPSGSLAFTLEGRKKAMEEGEK